MGSDSTTKTNEMSDLTDKMELQARDLINELIKEGELDPRVKNLARHLASLNLAYENLPEVQNLDNNLICYWINDEGQILRNMSIEEIVDRLEQHEKRQEALATLIKYETVKQKTKASTAFLLIEKAMAEMPAEQRAIIKKRLRPKVSAKCGAPRQRKPAGKEKQLINHLMKMGYSEEDAKKLAAAQKK